MAPCKDLTGPQHAIFSLLCSRRHSRTGISKYDTEALTQLLDLPQSTIRDEIDGLVDMELLDVSEFGLRPLSNCSCNRNQGRLLLNRRRDFQGEVPSTSNDAMEAPFPPEEPRSLGVRSLAAAKPRRNMHSRDSFYDRPEIQVTVKKLRLPGDWSYKELAQFFGRETVWKLRCAPPNYSALGRLLKDLGAAGVSKTEIHRMILIFVSDRVSLNGRPAWKVFYSRRDELLARARRRLRSAERVRSYEVEEEVESEVAVVRRESALSEATWARVKESV